MKKSEEVETMEGISIICEVDGWCERIAEEFVEFVKQKTNIVPKEVVRTETMVIYHFDIDEEEISKLWEEYDWD